MKSVPPPGSRWVVIAGTTHPLPSVTDLMRLQIVVIEHAFKCSAGKHELNLEQGM
ncbi:MAG TPA: hypothetical protein VKC61_16585 [Pyrinomonadaceae bacterium]|nr:hypothetical protein [Pyrinomonadaceae bacterium]